MRLLAKLSIAVLFILPNYGQSPDTTRTNGFYNGRLWVTIDRDSKIAFLMGFKEAAFQYRLELSADTCKTLDVKTSVLLSVFSTNMTVAQILESLDNFYSEVANRSIPIMNSLGQTEVRRCFGRTSRGLRVVSAYQVSEVRFVHLPAIAQPSTRRSR